jgi:hypothetical protein
VADMLREMPVVQQLLEQKPDLTDVDLFKILQKVNPNLVEQAFGNK